MKKFMVISVVALCLLVGYATPKVAGQGVPSGLPVPLAALAGNFAGISNIQLGLCFNSTFTKTESCLTKGAVTAQLNGVTLSQGVGDNKGNGCSSFTTTDTFLGGSLGPIVSTGITVVKNIDYIPTTGVGDLSYTNWSAGSCIGAVYSPSKGAVVTGTGVLHFVVSSNGNRIDFINTVATNPQNDIGSFAGSGFSLRQ